ncbi:hypothetical protein [Paenisporosarcina sp. TG20]|uniref:hypothetical protein n=1 Tax=Paenisporosarcina sp. TG20 TaxID=1211706 RepID=UPI0002E0E391|nr:hypothetical protein [Paenisporosarcina sp. TG20]
MENQTSLLKYQTEGGETKIHVPLVDDTVWMMQREIALLFQTTPQNITRRDETTRELNL